MQIGANEVAIVSLDGEPKHLVLPNTTRAFWKTITKVDDQTVKLKCNQSDITIIPGMAMKDGRSPPTKCS